MFEQNHEYNKVDTTSNKRISIVTNTFFDDTTSRRYFFKENCKRFSIHTWWFIWNWRRRNWKRWKIRSKRLFKIRQERRTKQQFYTNKPKLWKENLIIQPIFPFTASFFGYHRIYINTNLNCVYQWSRVAIHYPRGVIWMRFEVWTRRIINKEYNHGVTAFVFWKEGDERQTRGVLWFFQTKKKKKKNERKQE